MRTFVLRARHASTDPSRIRAQIGGREHFEVIAHTVINAFFVSSNFRPDVDMYVVLESTPDFPRTVHLSSAKGVSLTGFHEGAVIELFETALAKSQGINKNETRSVMPGVTVFGFGFEKLISQLIETHSLYLLGPKGTAIREINFPENPVFILSDHLAMPEKNVRSLKRKGLQLISLGKKMLFASQCVTILHYAIDNANEPPSLTKE